MIVLLFTVVPRRAELVPVHRDMTRRMHELAEATPGFLGGEYYDRPDGGTFGVLRFTDDAALAAWRDHPDHGAAHVRGVEEVYSTYRVEVCEVIRDSSFTWDPEAASSP